VAAITKISIAREDATIGFSEIPPSPAGRFSISSVSFIIRQGMVLPVIEEDLKPPIRGFTKWRSWVGSLKCAIYEVVDQKLVRSLQDGYQSPN
jgi:hypothetical protein